MCGRPKQEALELTEETEITQDYVVSSACNAISLQRLTWEDCKRGASLSYSLREPCFKVTIKMRGLG